MYYFHSFLYSGEIYGVNTSGGTLSGREQDNTHQKELPEGKLRRAPPSLVTCPWGTLQEPQSRHSAIPDPTWHCNNLNSTISQTSCVPMQNVTKHTMVDEINSVSYEVKTILALVLQTYKICKHSNKAENICRRRTKVVSLGLASTTPDGAAKAPSCS